MFFHGGNFLEDSTRQALLITAPSDSTYNIELYFLNKMKWVLIDKLENIQRNSSPFEVIYNDYNFDEQMDLFIQISASQGYSLSKGHLLIINPKTKKFELHEEAKELGNMKPDFLQKVVFSESFHGYDSKDSLKTSIFTNKWIGDQLTTVDERIVKFKP